MWLVGVNGLAGVGIVHPGELLNRCGCAGGNYYGDWRLIDET
jgi:hypothetical protein